MVDNRTTYPQTSGAMPMDRRAIRRPKDREAFLLELGVYCVTLLRRDSVM